MRTGAPGTCHTDLKFGQISARRKFHIDYLFFPCSMTRPPSWKKHQLNTIERHGMKIPKGIQEGEN
jgi:hypothetical protein